MQKIYWIFFLLLIVISSSAQNTFSSTNGVPGGNVYSITVDQSGKLYALEGQWNFGYRSTDNGATWKPFTVNKDFRTMYADGNNLYRTDYQSFYASTDGENWTKKSTGGFTNSYRGGLKKLPLPGDVFLNWSCDGVFISKDGGVNWKKISNQSECGFGMYGAAYTSSGHVYFWTANQNVQRHTVPGDGIWDATKVTTVFVKPQSYDPSISVGISASDKIYVTYRNAANTGNVISSSATGNSGTFTTTVTAPTTDLNGTNFWSLAPGGKLNLVANNKPYELTNEATPTWTARKIPNEGYSTYTVNTLTWKSATEVYAGIEGHGVFRSLDAGSTWTILNGSFPDAINASYTNDIEVLANGTIVAKMFHTVGGVWTSTNQGATYSYQGQAFMFNGNGSGGQKLIKLQDNSIIAPTTDGTRRTTDGILWTKQNATSYQNYVTESTNKIYGFTDTGVGLSTDLGVTFTPVSIPGFPTSGFTIDYVKYHSNNFIMAITYWSPPNKTEYWKINTSVSPWQATKLVTPLNTGGGTCSGLVAYKNTLYAGDHSIVAYSTNLGTWNTMAKPHHFLLELPPGSAGVGISDGQLLWTTQDDGKNWEGFTLPGIASDLAVDAGNNVFAAVNGGPVAKFSGNLSMPEGELDPLIDPGWQSLKGPYGGRFTKLLKNNSNQMFAAGGNGLVRYNSVTTQWDRLIIPGLVWNFRDAIIDASGKIYVISADALYTSTDSGTTWTRVATTAFLSDLRQIIKTPNGTLIITTGNGIRISSNDGINFSTPATAASGAFDGLAISSTGVLVTSQNDNGTKTVIASIDNGLTWTAGTGIDLSGDKKVMSVHALDAGALAVVTSDKVYKSTNGGASWTSIMGNLPAFAEESIHRKIYYSPANSQYYFTYKDAVYSSSNNGSTWTKRSSIEFNHEINDFMWINTTMYAATQQSGIKVSLDAGDTFTKFQDNIGLNSEIYVGLVLSEGKMFVLPCCGNLLKSTDDGQTFAPEVTGTGVYTDRIIKSTQDSLIAYGGGFAVSIDNGITWVNQNSSGGYFENLKAIELDGVVTYYAVRSFENQRMIVKSTNLKDWTSISPHIPYGVQTIAPAKDGSVYYLMYNDASPAHEVYRIEGAITNKVDFGKYEPESVHYYNGKIYVFSWARVLFETTDGVTWTSRAATQGGRMKVTKNGYFFLFDEGVGVLSLSRDQGKSWQSISPFGYDAVMNIEIDEATGYAYALVADRSVQKSSNIMIPPDNVAPVLAGRSPANDLSIVKDFNIVLTFNEAVKPIAGKRVRLFETSSPNVPLEVFDVQSGVKSNNGKTLTFTPTQTRLYLKSYFILVDNGAFTDIFGNSYVGIATSTDWTFTTQDEPDPTKPEIAFTPVNLEKGTALTINITVTDNKAIQIANTKIYYRGISALDGAPFSSATLTTSSSEPVTNATFTINAAESWYDPMGLEFYFEAEDKAGNKQRSPATANKYHYSYIEYGEARPKLTGLAYGETVSSYRIISIPYDLVDNQVGTVFNELGEANKANWRMLTTNSSGKYEEYPAAFKTVSRGKGYWFIMRSFSDIFVENATTPENNRTEVFNLTLHQGWNQIGNPYTVPISWEEVRNPASTKVDELIVFRNGDYVAGDVLNAFEGGFVHASTEVSVKVGFKGVSPGRKSSVGSDLASTQWEVPIHIRQGDIGNLLGGIGMNEEASEESDPFDRRNPPFLGERVELNFLSNTEALAKNVVPLQENFSWRLKAISVAGRDTEIAWSNEDFGDNSKELFLLDEASSILVNMRTQSRYIFNSKGARNFTIYFGENIRGTIKPFSTLLGEPWPNPTDQNLTIPFTVADEAGKFTGRIEVYNSVGNRISLLEEGEFEPGFYSVEWDTQHSYLAPGLYFCRMTGHNENGNTVTQIKKVILKR